MPGMQQLQIQVPPTNVKIVVGTEDTHVTSIGIELDGVRFVASGLPFIGIEKRTLTLETLDTFAHRLELVGINVEGRELIEPLLAKSKASLAEFRKQKK